MAAIPGLSGGGGVFEQFFIWGVLQQVVGPILQPIVQQILDETFPRLPSMPLSPAQVADLVLKTWMTKDDGYQEVASSGINHERFDQMVNDAGEPIALQSLMEAWRRGIIGWDSAHAGDNTVVDGIRQSRIRDQWTPVIEALRDVLIPVGDAVSAALRGQIPYADAEAIAGQNGITPANFKILVDVAGNPPGPGELITLVRRGFIPVDGTGPDVLSLQQGIYEGDTKDKWFPMYLKLMEYLPPPRTITALERAGVLTPAAAQALYQQQGLTPELAAIYSADASAVKLVKTKELAEGTVLQLYRAGTIPQGEASSLLSLLGYSAQEVAWILAWSDLHRELAALNSAVTKVGTLYMARKIGETSAIAALGQLGIPGSQQTELLRTWTLERDATVKVLTAAEIADALFYQVIDQPAAMNLLQSLGYDPYDAWIVLSIRMHAALPDAPPVPAEPTGQLP